MNYPITILDLETTGVNTREDRIVEIAVIRINEDKTRVVKRMILNPEIPIPEAATKCHGITDEQVKDCPTFKQIAKALHEFIKDIDLVLYNGISFDVPMLYCEFLRAGITWDYSTSNLIDACNIFKRKEERTLEAAVHFYLYRLHIGAHGAQTDAEATIEVLENQLARYGDLETKTNKELALYSNFDREILDIAGCFAKDEQGRIIFNFGKHKGKLASEQRHYLKWMLEQDFMPDTRKIIHKIIG